MIGRRAELGLTVSHRSDSLYNVHQDSHGREGDSSAPKAVESHSTDDPSII